MTPRIEGNNSYTVAANDVNRAEQNGGEKYIKIKVVFTPSELGVKKDGTGNYPSSTKISESKVEQRIFERFNLDPKNPVNQELLKLRFDTKGKPEDALNWVQAGKTVHSFSGVKNAQGNYEVTVLLRQETFQKLKGETFTPSPANQTNAGTTRAIDPKDALSAKFGLDVKQTQAITKAQQLTPDTEGLTPEQQALILDLTQVGLSIAGIFDPTGIADGADALISLGRGDYWGAGISALGMIPYIGDIAKVGKLPKLVQIVENVVNMAKKSPDFAKAVGKLLEGLKNTLDAISLDKLPKSLRESVESMKGKIDELFANPQTRKTVLERGDGAFLRETTFDYKSPHNLFPQLHEGSCVAASTKMILNTGDIPEAYIRQAAKVDVIDGAKLSDVPKALADLGEAYGIKGMEGFKYSEKLKFSDLENAVKNNPVIVSIKTEATGGAHALVVDAVKDGKVFLRDSLPVGQGSMYAVSIEDFAKAWSGKAVYKP